jgi:uncharacterized membrane protein YagU involved in acid resistance
MNPKSVLNGAIAGVIGGVVFGPMMGAMGMLPMIGKMVGQPNAVAGFALHLVISAVIGASYGLIAGRFHPSLAGGFVTGSLYGAAWWLLGPLTLMPLLMGMGLGVNWNATAAAAMLPSLFGHLIYGALLGVSFSRLTRRSTTHALAHEPRVNTARTR